MPFKPFICSWHFPVYLKTFLFQNLYDKQFSDTVSSLTLFIDLYIS